MSGIATDSRCKPQLVRPLFILGCHKSGTSLLRSLLDAHHDLAVIPMELHFFECSSYWVDYPLRRTLPHGQCSREEFIHAAVAQMKRQNTNEDRYADADMNGKIDIAVFRAYLSGATMHGPGEAYTAYVKAVWRAVTGTSLPPDSRVVEKTVENAEYAPILRMMFPDSHFVHILRNPYATLVAIRRARSNHRKYPVIWRFVKSIESSFYNLYRNEQFLDKYHVLLYEDLIRDPHKSMRELANRVGLSWDDSLLWPTSRGVPWKGNSTSNRCFEGIDASPLDAWKDEITPLEVHWINRMLGHVLARFGYARIRPERGLRHRIRGEGLRTYITNRIRVGF